MPPDLPSLGVVACRHTIIIFPSSGQKSWTKPRCRSISQLPDRSCNHNTGDLYDIHMYYYTSLKDLSLGTKLEMVPQWLSLTWLSSPLWTWKGWACRPAVWGKCCNISNWTASVTASESYPEAESTYWRWGYSFIITTFDRHNYQGVYLSCSCTYTVQGSLLRMRGINYRLRHVITETP